MLLSNAPHIYDFRIKTASYILFNLLYRLYLPTVTKVAILRIFQNYYIHDVITQLALSIAARAIVSNNLQVSVHIPKQNPYIRTFTSTNKRKLQYKRHREHQPQKALYITQLHRNFPLLIRIFYLYART